MNKTLFLFNAVAVCAALTFTGCKTPYREIDPDTPSVNGRLGPENIRRTAEKMADSLASDPNVVLAAGGQKPVLDVIPMENRSEMIIDMKMVTDSIRMRLIRSGLFTFTDNASAVSTDIAIMDQQAQLGLTDPRKAIRGGQQEASRFILTGSLSSMGYKYGNVTDRYYKFSMTLKDIQKGTIIWADEQDVRKAVDRSWF